MSRVNFPLAWVLILVVFVTPGCQDGPTNPDTQSPQELSTSAVQEGSLAHQCLGFYSLAVDTENLQIEVLPVRTGEWHFNMTGVLNGTMGVSAAVVPGESDPASGLFVLDIILTHPFPTKLQFSGFDVKGILITPGSFTHNSLYFGDLVFADVNETRLENADGYTRWWNPTEFTTPGILGYVDGILPTAPASELTATINPYKLFADILGAEDSLSLVANEPLDNPHGRAIFTSGSVNTRRYRIRFPLDPGPQIVFGYAIDCAWNPPSPNPPEEIPDDFSIKANQPEAYHLVVQPAVNTLYYDSETGKGGGVLRLQIDVYDWQGQVAGDIDNEVDALWLFSPDLMGTDMGSAGFISETPIKASYAADLTGKAIPTEAGEALLFCKVQDNEGYKYEQTSAAAPNFGVGAWQVITLDIPDPDCVADSNNDFPDAVPIYFGDQIVDQICNWDDPVDYYSIVIPPGYKATGNVKFWCNASPPWPDSPALSLFDESECIITNLSVTDGVAVISFDDKLLMPGKYYLATVSGCTEQMIPYLLELDGELVNVEPVNPVEVTPSTLYVNPFFVWLHDHYAYLVGYGSWVYDIADPANPIQVGCNEDIIINGWPCFSWPYCYYIVPTPAGDEIRLIDFSDVSNPVLHEGILNFPSDVSSICMDSTHLYLSYWDAPFWHLAIYEYVSDPLNPTLLGSELLTFEPLCMSLTELETWGTWLVVGGSSIIYAYGVDDPSSITSVVPYPFPGGEPKDIATDGELIYLAYDKGAWDGFLYIMWLDPGMPGFIEYGSLDLPGGARAVVEKWPYLYIGDREAGLTICDVTFPDTPTHIGSTPMIAMGFDLAIDNDTLYIIPFPAGLQVFDISIPTSPAAITHLPVVTAPRRAVTRDNYLMVVEHAGGGYDAIKTVDITDPPNAQVVGEWFSSIPIRDAALDGDVFATARNKNFLLLDASDLENLDLLCVGSTFNDIEAIGLYGDALYISTDLPEVKVYDISALPAYSNTANIPLSNDVIDFTFSGNYMYLSTKLTLETYSLTDPFHPVYESSYSVVGNLAETDVQGDYLHMVKEGGFEIANLDDPELPVYEGHYNLLVPGDFFHIALDGQYAYLGGSGTAPYAFTTWPPDSPTFYSSIYSHEPYGACDLQISDGYLYEVTSFVGVRIHDLY